MELKKVFILNLLLAVSLVSYSQDRDDYIVTIKNDTLYGKVETAFNSLNPFGKYQLKLTSGGSEKYFLRSSEIIKSYKLLNDVFVYKKTKNQAKKYTLLKQLVFGEINFYQNSVSYTHQSGPSGMGGGMTSTKDIYYIEYEDGSFKKVTYGYWHNKLIPYLLKCDFIKLKYNTKIESFPVAISFSVVDAYNKNCN